MSFRSDDWWAVERHNMRGKLEEATSPSAAWNFEGNVVPASSLLFLALLPIPKPN